MLACLERSTRSQKQIIIICTRIFFDDRITSKKTVFQLYTIYMCDAHWRIVMLTWHQINVIWLHFIVESQNNVIARRERESSFTMNLLLPRHQRQCYQICEKVEFLVEGCRNTYLGVLQPYQLCTIFSIFGVLQNVNRLIKFCAIYSLIPCFFKKSKFYFENCKNTNLFIKKKLIR